MQSLVWSLWLVSFVSAEDTMFTQWDKNTVYKFIFKSWKDTDTVNAYAQLQINTQWL